MLTVKRLTNSRMGNLKEAFSYSTCMFYVRNIRNISGKFSYWYYTATNTLVVN